MKNFILTLMAVLASQTASADSWKITDKESTEDDAAHICYFWNATIFLPGQDAPCSIGTMHSVDLEKREISYARTQGLDNGYSEADRELERSNLANALKEEGFSRLEALRSALMEKREQERMKAMSEFNHAAYLSTYQAISTLQDAEAFERKYSSSDPDGLVTKIGPLKEKLRSQPSPSRSTDIQVSAGMERFIAESAEYDAEHMVTKFITQTPWIKTQKSQASLSASSTTDAGHTPQGFEIKPESTEDIKKRLENIKDLQTKYTAKIKADSPDALRRVMAVNIDCKLPDRRVLPLSHAIFISIRVLERSGVTASFRIRNTGPQIRVYSELSNNGKRADDLFLYYLLNEKNELTSLAVKPKGLMNACRGVYGPVWLLPGEPGY